jgi:hypothetical protein
MVVLSLFASFLPSISGDVISRHASPVTARVTTTYEGSLSGYVTDPAMNPIEGARVRVYFHGNYSENYSDASGHYHVTNIPLCYCLKNTTCSKEGYNTEEVWLSIYENTTYNFVLTTASLPCYPIFNGTMGDNGWYVSNVTITLVVNGYVDAIYYRFDNGSWIEYTEPFFATISEDGFHTFYWRYWYQGNLSDVYQIDFKIDQTVPTITLSQERIALNKVKITANVSDETSGINRVKFRDGWNEHTDYTSPYEVIFLGFGIHMVTATVYDNAGNIAVSKIITPCSQSISSYQSQISSSSQQLTQSIQLVKTISK